ncbi:MAG: hypothetical protein AB9866_23770 [Syntrophobacteraceae bacterium]
MRRTVYPCAPICLSILLFFTGLGEGAEYFPLREGFTSEVRMSQNQGQSRNVVDLVLTNGPEVDLDGLVAGSLTIAMKSDGEMVAKFFFHENEQGLRIVAEQGSGDKSAVMKKNEEWEFKYPLAVGNSWTESEEVSLLKEKALVTMTHTIEKIDDVVTVPAGTFEKCLKIRKHFHGKANLGSYGGSPEITVEGFTWYAPGIGQIKATETLKCSRPETGGEETTFEMISFKKLTDPGVE